jgi:hypothetical protein
MLHEMLDRAFERVGAFQPSAVIVALEATYDAARSVRAGA